MDPPCRRAVDTESLYQRFPPQTNVSHQERLDLARKQVNLVGLEESRTRLYETVVQIMEGQPEWERLRTSKFARQQARLESQPVIEQANGILLAQCGFEPEEALNILRHAAERANLKGINSKFHVVGMFGPRSDPRP